MLTKATPTTVLLARGKSSKLEVKTENLKYFRAEAFENDSPVLPLPGTQSQKWLAGHVHWCQVCIADNRQRSTNAGALDAQKAKGEGKRTLGCIKAPQSD